MFRISSLLRSSAAALFVTVAGCSSDESPTGRNEDDLRPGPATQLVVIGGDNQTAAPLDTLVARPDIAVRDANGRGVRDVQVTFAIDAGDGSISTTQATSDSAGVVHAGAWRLGPREGANRLRASATGLPAVTVSATARYPDVAAVDTTIGISGGTVRVTRGGLPGLTISVPAG